ncbi:amino acid transporter [Penicillium canescens]|uniref:Amino acid transporter n=1 Tax=Penicillium canescens TaxID=5083 RepID=A0AAD6N6Y6_PENCN|nr:amino acid transporter [Penicillium canescens]KAJ6020158.1 amino acid transporter [Penicillium canescens]KAJ6038105.1 amino acid transporter [Penicillium canescens]KAJ6045512.1 amino acid transporter [Penicillium canescens]KAJ6061196.1 amino acid transporter [Penicillium canescens]KAJ6090736.1 amino acid transporter [Penicillium canescens]
MIALGSSIGTGLWLGSGTALKHGGPAAIFIAYLLASSIVWSVMHSIGEMAVLYPLPSAFTQWTGKFVGRAAALALGWSYVFGHFITMANEISATSTVISFWTRPVRIFGEVEVVLSIIKFGWMIVVIISFLGRDTFPPLPGLITNNSSLVITAGGAPAGSPIGFRYWGETGGFLNGFKGFLNTIPTCIFAMAGSEASALVAGEAANPRKAIPRAVVSVWIRLSLFYLLGSVMVTLTVSPFNPNLYGGVGVNASPFVIAYRDAKLDVLAHFTNAIILISVLSTGSIQAYAGARTLLGLSELGMAPAIFSKADKSGRPWAGLIPSLLFGGALAFLNVDNSGATVFTWFSHLTSLVTLFGWSMIFLSHLRMRYAWKAQGRSACELPWKSRVFPWSACWGLFWCVLIVIIEFYLAVWPLGAPSSAKNFFTNYLSVIVSVAIFLLGRIVYRGRWWPKASDIDLDDGRRFYHHVDQESPARKGLLARVAAYVLS